MPLEDLDILAAQAPRKSRMINFEDLDVVPVNEQGLWNPESIFSKTKRIGSQMLESAGEKGAEGITQIQEAISPETTQGKERTTTQRVGEALGGVGNIASAALETTATLGAPIAAALEDPIQSFVKSSPKAQQALKAFTEDMPNEVANQFGIPFEEAKQKLGNIFVGLTSALAAPAEGKVLQNIGKTTVSPRETLGAALEEGAQGMKKGIQAVEESIPRNIEEGVIKQVDETIAKAIKPRKQFNTEVERKRYVQKSRQAVETIAENKQALKFTDEAGEIVEGQLPRSVQQMSEALDQTKKSIYKQYSDISKKTGAVGESVSVSPVVDELVKLSDNVAIKVASPSTLKYIKERINTFTKQGAFSPTDTEEVIKVLNDRLKTFYRGGADNVSDLAVDAMIASKLREQLDSLIESATGEAYQSLKNQYGALKQIEKDVVRAAQRVANKNSAGLVDALSGLATANQVAQFITTGGFGNLVQGAATEGVRRWWNAINSPDRAIKNMFEKVDAARQSKNSRSLKTAKADTIKATKNTIVPILQQKTKKVNSPVFNTKGMTTVFSPSPSPLSKLTVDQRFEFNKFVSAAKKKKISGSELLKTDSKFRDFIESIGATDTSAEWIKTFNKALIK